MKFILYLTLAVTMVLSVTVTYQFNSIASARADSRAQTCQAFEQLNSTFTKLIRSGEKQASTLLYYREHPNELVRVLAADERSVVALRNSLPTYC